MDKLAYINKQLAGVEKKKVYFEYRRIGSTTIPGNYFYKMIEYAGGANIFSDAKNVNVDPESIIERNPEYIIKVSNVNVQSTYEPPTADEQKAIFAEIKNRPGWDSIDAVKIIKFCFYLIMFMEEHQNWLVLCMLLSIYILTNCRICIQSRYLRIG